VTARRITRRDWLFFWSIVLPAKAEKSEELWSGFRFMYHLRFAEARIVFLDWQKKNPHDAMGFAAEAAAHLFEEFERHGVLTREFFLDDDLFLGGIRGTPNAASVQAFERAHTVASKLGQARLRVNELDPDALLAMSMTAGLRADFASLIAKRQVEALRQIRRAESYSNRLLKVAPQMGDAYMALGAASYIIACLPAYKRAVLFVGGIRGDRRRGLEQLARAARTGRYLAPFAKVMLALSMFREKQPAEGRRLLAELAAEFPQSPLFARELTKK